MTRFFRASNSVRDGGTKPEILGLRVGGCRDELNILLSPIEVPSEASGSEFLSNGSEI